MKIIRPDQIVVKLKSLNHRERIDLAEKLGMSSDTLYRYMREEKRAKNMGFEYVQKLSKELLDAE